MRGFPLQTSKGSFRLPDGQERQCMPVAIEKSNQQTLTPSVKKAAAIQVSPRLAEAARLEPAEVLRLMETSAEGLSSEVAAERLEQYGLNEVAREKKQNWVQRLYLAPTSFNPYCSSLSAATSELNP